jgi:hypothetical protein
MGARAKRGKYGLPTSPIIANGFVRPSHPDETYIAEAISELTSNPVLTIAQVSHLIPKVHFWESNEEHRKERERIRSMLRRALPERLISIKRP